MNGCVPVDFWWEAKTQLQALAGGSRGDEDDWEVAGTAREMLAKLEERETKPFA
ncbi:hypothetical protein TWF696_005429 [Orbilia brochopaga]|uniref:Uncharacterized protein n=1 Tax=Orbilia brochopaga TaxID=3140254 RepID=A0AAV9V3V0_9PEZI